MQEMAAITDNYLYNDLQQRDSARGMWMNDDPSLQDILDWIAQNL